MRVYQMGDTLNNSRKDLFKQQTVPCFGAAGWQGARLRPVAADWPGVTHQMAGRMPPRHLGLGAVEREPLILHSTANQTIQVHANEYRHTNIEQAHAKVFNWCQNALPHLQRLPGRGRSCRACSLLWGPLRSPAAASPLRHGRIVRRPSVV